MPSENLSNGQTAPNGTTPGPRAIADTPRDQPQTKDDLSQIDALLAGANGRAPAEGGRAPAEGGKNIPGREKSAEGQGKDERFRPESIFEDDEFYQEEQGSQQKQGRTKGAKSLEDFAAELELKADDLLDLVITGEDGEEPMPVRAAIERLKEVKQFEQRRDEFEDYHANATQEIMSARQHMAGMIDRMRNLVEPEVMARVFADTLEDRKKHIEDNRKQLFEYVPEWRDPTTRDGELKEMDGFFQKMFQFGEGEIRQITDARLMYAARFMWKLVGRYERSKAELKKLSGRIPASEPSRRGQRVDSKQQIREQAQSDHDGAVSKILGLTQ